MVRLHLGNPISTSVSRTIKAASGFYQIQTLNPKPIPSSFGNLGVQVVWFGVSESLDTTPCRGLGFREFVITDNMGLHKVVGFDACMSYRWVPLLAALNPKPKTLIVEG